MLFTPPTTPVSHHEGFNTSELSEFACNMVYLMWHARKPTNSLVSDKSWSPSLMNTNNELAHLMWQSRKPMNKQQHYSPLYGSDSYQVNYTSTTASPAFKKFCFQVLTATQLQESAVYLSLKYIAILLQSNPTIEGAEGSEYRLFIVALMLANKFLDDNTFTNKTWSEVSGMKVHDLNIMESEFLEALDYNLFVREHEYGIWKQLLEECRDRSKLSYYDHPQQRQQLILMTLETLGLSNNNHKWNMYDATRLQLENSQKRYQYFLHQKLPTPMNNYYNYPITNLSQSSWDPLAYSLNRCQDYSYYSNSTTFDPTPISWRNYN